MRNPEKVTLKPVQYISSFDTISKWNDLSYSGNRSDQQFHESGREIETGKPSPELNTDVGARIGIILKPQKDDLSMGNLHVVINGRDQGPVRTGIRIDDLQMVESIGRGRLPLGAGPRLTKYQFIA